MKADRHSRGRPTIDCDVVIVGAGPAGCAAAITARQASLSVVLVEAHAVPGRAPGETLHPGVEPILRQLGVWNEVAALGFHRHRGVWRQSGGQRTFAAYGADVHGEWLGLQADRRALQNVLQRAAIAAGVNLMRTTPCAVLRQSTRIVGVALETADVRARWTMDATGRRAWLASRLGVKAHRPGPSVRVRFGWFDEEPPDLAGQPLFQERTDGWAWLAPLGDGRTAWAELRLAGYADGAAAWSGLDMTWRLHRACAGPGYFLLGDAAALLDPAASNGVLRALMSGILAAHLAATAKRTPVDATTAIASYIEWVVELFTQQERMLSESYRLGQDRITSETRVVAALS